MPDFLDKLNLLLRSNMNSFLSDPLGKSTRTTPPTPEELEAELAAPSQRTASQKRISPERLGKDIDREIIALRRHIDQALADEDKMRDKLDQMQAQMDDLDRKADEALQQGDPDKARDYVRQLNRQKQLSDQQRVELKRHGTATSELIERVNTLEAIVSDARRQQQEQSASLVSTTTAEAPPEGMLSTFLRDARERVEAAINTPPAESPTQTPTAESKSEGQGVNVPVKIVNDPDVEADLARRRARLSKPE